MSRFELGCAAMQPLYDRQKREAYAAVGCHAVEGYLHSGSASVICSIFDVQDEMEISGNVAEVGVYQGKLFVLLCHALRRGEQAFAIDVFDTQADVQGITSAEQGRQFSPDNVTANLAAQGIDIASVQLVVANSQAVTADQLRAEFGVSDVRIFSVDGDHSRTGVRHDLNLAASALCAGGIVLADDLFNTICPSLTEGIIDFFREDNDGRLAPVAIISANGPQHTGSTKLVLSDAAYAERYKAYLQLLNRSDYSHSDDFLGFEHVLIFDFKNEPTRHPLDDDVRRAVAEYFAGR